MIGWIMMDHIKKYVYTCTHIKKIIVIDFEFFFAFNNARILTKKKIVGFFSFISNFIINCNRKIQTFYLILSSFWIVHMFMYLSISKVKLIAIIKITQKLKGTTTKRTLKIIEKWNFWKYYSVRMTI